MADENTSNSTPPSFLDEATPTVDPTSLAARKASFDQQTDKVAIDSFNGVLAMRENLWNNFWLGAAGLSPEDAAAAKGNKCVSFFVADAATVAMLLAIKPGCIPVNRQGVHPDYTATPNADGTVTITKKVTA